MYRSFLSWRYLTSRPTNLIGIVGVLVGVGALILILSIMTGFLEESRKTVRGTLSDVIVAPRQGDRGRPGAVPADAAPLLARVRADKRVAAASAQLAYGGLITQSGNRASYFQRQLASSDGLVVVQLVGIDIDGVGRLLGPGAALVARALGGWMPLPRVQDELDSTAFLRSLVGDGSEDGDAWTEAPVNPFFPFATGPAPALGRPRAGVLVGDQLFAQLDLQVGQEIEISTAVYDPARQDWGPSNRVFVVAGSFRTRDNETDLHRLYFDRRELANFLGYTREYTQVLARLVDYDADATDLTRDMRKSLGEHGLIAGGLSSLDEVKTWEEFQGNLLGAIENERVLMAIMLSLVLLVASFTIFAILSMMVTEKRRDIGILTALGATPSGVQQLFLMIAFWDALLGGVLGAVIGTWGAVKIDPIERWLSATFGIQIFNRNVYLFDHIPSVVQPLWVGAIVLGGFLCALLFAWFPAWRAARLDPLEALRYE